MAAIETSGLGRTYKSANGQRDALTDITLTVDDGEVRGLLGPNGAGKTTLVKILCTALLPSAGTASILGHDVVKDTAAVRRSIGVVLGGDRGLYSQLTAREMLEYWAALYDVPSRVARTRALKLLERVGIEDRANDRIETFSRGMKQRLHLARGLISDARILFLDEPTIGMDPLGARDFRNLVLELKAEGRTILITTHDMAEAEAVCDRVALIDRGRLLATETPASLAKLVSAHERIDFTYDDCALSERIRQLPGVASVDTQPDGSYRVALSEAGAINEVLANLVSQGVTSLNTSRPNLEEVYIAMLGPGRVVGGRAEEDRVTTFDA